MNPTVQPGPAYLEGRPVVVIRPEFGPWWIVLTETERRIRVHADDLLPVSWAWAEGVHHHR